MGYGLLRTCKKGQIMAKVESRVWKCTDCIQFGDFIPCFVVSKHKPSNCILYWAKDDFKWEECTHEYMLYMFDTVLEK